MTTKEYLSQAFRLDHRINCKLAQIEKLRELATRIREREENVQRIRETERSLNDEANRLIGLSVEIEESIQKLENRDQRLILEFRYVLCKSWQEIAELFGLSKRSVYRLHNQALKEFERLNPNLISSQSTAVIEETA